MNPIQRRERRLRVCLDLCVERPMKHQGFGNEKDQCEKQPDADHGMHPPEIDRSEAIPSAELGHHVKASQGDHDRGYPRLLGKPPLDGLKALPAVWPEPSAANGRQHDCRDHGDTADPYDDGEDMQSTGDCEPGHRDVSHLPRRSTDRSINVTPLAGLAQ